MVMVVTFVYGRNKPRKLESLSSPRNLSIDVNLVCHDAFSCFMFLFVVKKLFCYLDSSEQFVSPNLFFFFRCTKYLDHFATHNTHNL